MKSASASQLGMTAAFDMRMSRICVLLLTILAAACGDSATRVTESIPLVTTLPFDSLAQAQLTSKLTLFGGGGQWTINLEVVVHNTTSVPRTFAISPGCPALLFAFANAQGTGTPAWSTLSQKPGCTQPSVLDTIGTGDSLVLNAPATSTNEILANNGSSNPPGQYFFFYGVRTPLATGGEARALVGFSLLSP